LRLKHSDINNRIPCIFTLGIHDQENQFHNLNSELMVTTKSMSVLAWTF
jgi:hypothetical protein